MKIGTHVNIPLCAMWISNIISRRNHCGTIMRSSWKTVPSCVPIHLCIGKNVLILIPSPILQPATLVRYSFAEFLVLCPSVCPLARVLISCTRQLMHIAYKLYRTRNVYLSNHAVGPKAFPFLAGIAGPHCLSIIEWALIYFQECHMKWLNHDCLKRLMHRSSACRESRSWVFRSQTVLSTVPALFKRTPSSTAVIKKPSVLE